MARENMLLTLSFRIAAGTPDESGELRPSA